MTSYTQQSSSQDLQGSSPDLQGSGQSLQGSSPGLQRQGMFGNSFLQGFLFGGGQDQQQGGATTPAVDITQHQWLIDIYVNSEALGQEEAVALVRSATPAQLQEIMVCTEGVATPVASDVPAANMDVHRSNRARPLDWSSAPGAGHISPEAPTEGGPVATTPMQDTFASHRAQLMEEDFGAAANIDTIRSAIALAELLSRATVAAHLRARLFRINQYAVVETLNSEDSGRYQPGGGKTYCNIYAYDVVTALGAYIPRVWWTADALRRIQQGEQVAVQYGQTVSELNANALNRWMREWGDDFGWTEAADMTAAQTEANSGKIVVILAANANASRSGHITVVMAERGDHTAQRHPATEEGGTGAVEAPLQSQAGSRNFKYDDNSAGLNRDQWWENASHVDGAAWVNNGSGQSSIITPTDLGR